MKVKMMKHSIAQAPIWVSCCQWPGTGKPIDYSPSRTLRQCATGKDRKVYVSTSAAAFPFQAHNA